MRSIRLACFVSCAFAAAFIVSGCGDNGGIGNCGGVGQACCNGTCANGLFCQSDTCRAPGRSPIALNYSTKVDVLFMVDDSPSMEPMAVELRNRFPEFFQVFQTLAQQSFYADLHIGVVTSDFGAGATGAPGCDRGGGGRMGQFQPIGKNAAPNCLPPIGADYVQYVFGATGDGPNNLPPGQDLLQTFTCMASVGSAGCGFEHQLESTYYSLANAPAGFLRDDAILAVVFLTNEDDCSAPFDSDLFDETKDAEYGYLDSYRCTRFGIVHGNPPVLFPYADSGGPLTMTASAPNPMNGGPGKLWDISRYLTFFTQPSTMGGIKADPNDITLLGIDAPADPASVILSDPNTAGGLPYAPCNAINENIIPACVPVLQHSCINPNNTDFFGDPSIRLNTVIQASTHGSVASICDNDYSSVMTNLGNQIASQLGLGCVGDKLPPDPNNPGQVLADCVVTDVTEANGNASVYTIPACTMPATVFPCWKLEMKAACATASPQGLGITIDRNGAPTPPSANIKASCTTLAM